MMAIPDIFLQIVREKLTSESPASQSQVLQKETVEMNETPSSPIAPKSIETPVYTPSQTQQVHGQKKSWIFKLMFESFRTYSGLTS